MCNTLFYRAELFSEGKEQLNWLPLKIATNHTSKHGIIRIAKSGTSKLVVHTVGISEVAVTIQGKF